jgi:hypothetical protein
MLKEVLRFALFPALLLTTTCERRQSVEFLGTPLSAQNQREMDRAVRRVAGDRYNRVVITITDRVVRVKR